MAPRSETTVTSFGNVPKAVQEGNETAILSILARVSAQAKGLAQVDKGQMRNSIMYRSSIREGGFNESGGERAPTKLSDNPKKGQGVVGSNLLHAIYNEFGTRFMVALPFLRPAVAIEGNGSKSKEAIKKYENESVKAETQKGPRKRKTFK